MNAPEMILFEWGSHISWWSALGSVPDKVAFAATNANSNPAKMEMSAICYQSDQS